MTVKDRPSAPAVIVNDFCMYPPTVVALAVWNAKLVDSIKAAIVNESSSCLCFDCIELEIPPVFSFTIA
jgi:hypothetical protein